MTPSHWWRPEILVVADQFLALKSFRRHGDRLQKSHVEKYEGLQSRALELDVPDFRAPLSGLNSGLGVDLRVIQDLRSIYLFSPRIE